MTTVARPATARPAGAGHRNALNAIRLLLAGLVIVTHTGSAPWDGEGWIAGDTLGGWAVAGFFAISGYLVALSRSRTTLADYLRRRAVRIFPGYWFSLVVIAAVVAPLSAWWTGAHWEFGSAAGYVARNATLVQVQPGIEQTLTQAPYPLVWNLSAWTLAYEFACYLILGVLLPRASGARAVVVSAALFGLCTLVSMPRFKPALPYEVFTLARLGTYFFAGALLLVLGGRVRWTPRIALASMLAIVALGWAGRLTWLGALPIAFLVLWLGRSLPTRLGSTHDVSYGVYLYGFPAQQLLTAYGPWNQGAYFAAVLAMATGLAWISWLVIERPSMRWRRSLSATPQPPPRADQVGS